MKEFKAVIFDIDGTLIDTFEASLISMQKGLYDVLGKTYTREELIFHFGIPLEEALDELKIPKEKYNIIGKKIDYYYNQERNNISFYDGIETLLEELDKKEIKMGIVTSQLKYEYNEGLNKTEIAQYFKTVICADDTSRRKPYPDPLELYISKEGYKKEEVIYIGDTIYDSKAAESAGIKFGLALWGALDKEVKANYYFEQPNDVLKLF